MEAHQTINPQDTSLRASSQPHAARRDHRAQDPKTHERIRRIAYSRCPAWLAHKREDIAQKASLRLLENAKKKQDPNYCGSYLYRVVASVIVEELRSSRKRNEHTPPPRATQHEQHVENTPSHTPDPERSLSHRGSAQGIEACMKKLLEDRRVAVTLSLQGYKASEIAALCNWNTKRAENLILRGRNQLRSCLKARGLYGVA